MLWIKYWRKLESSLGGKTKNYQFWIFVALKKKTKKLYVNLRANQGRIIAFLLKKKKIIFSRQVEYTFLELNMTRSCNVIEM